ncbi:hypothetical protein IM774_07130 [Erysipelotrichaceae bacterium RD49]|nr:hypothetical protein [Erysipelotrichaceae bacterium RD49]
MTNSARTRSRLTDSKFVRLLAIFLLAGAIWAIRGKIDTTYLGVRLCKLRPGKLNHLVLDRPAFDQAFGQGQFFCEADQGFLQDLHLFWILPIRLIPEQSILSLLRIKNWKKTNSAMI